MHVSPVPKILESYNGLITAQELELTAGRASPLPYTWNSVAGTCDSTGGTSADAPPYRVPN